MDNTRLDQYTARLSTSLTHLTAAQRAEELHEIRQHLDALVAGQIAHGHDEADAVELALRQFGHAEDVGRELAAAQRNRRTLRAPVISYVCMVVVIFALFATANDKPTDFPYGWINQLLLACILPAGFLTIQIGKYVRFNRR